MRAQAHSSICCLIQATAVVMTGARLFLFVDSVTRRTPIWAAARKKARAAFVSDPSWYPNVAAGSRQPSDGNLVSLLHSHFQKGRSRQVTSAIFRMQGPEMSGAIRFSGLGSDIRMRRARANGRPDHAVLGARHLQ